MIECRYLTVQVHGCLLMLLARCNSLAHAEMRLILAKILWNFDLELAGDGNGKDWITTQKVFILWEKGPLNVFLKPVRR